MVRLGRGQILAPSRDLFDWHAEMCGELAVVAVCHRRERDRRQQQLARVALGAARHVAPRLVRQLPALDVAGVAHEKAHEALERVAVGARGDVWSEVEAIAPANATARRR